MAERLAEAEPANTSYQRDLSISYNKLGDLELGEGRSGDARRLYQQSVAVAERLAEAEPANASYQRDLSISYERLGDLCERDDDTAHARDHFLQADARRAGLCEQEPERSDLAVERSYVLYRLHLLGVEMLAQGLPSRLIVRLLTKFESEHRLDDRGTAILTWARQTSERD